MSCHRRGQTEDFRVSANSDTQPGWLSPPASSRLSSCRGLS